MSVDYLLHESSMGYGVFKVTMQPDTIGSSLNEVQESMQDLGKFGKMIELVSFAPFQGAQQALESINNASEGIVSEYLQAILESTLPKAGKKTKIILGVSDKTLAGSIKDVFPDLSCETADTSDVVSDLLRGLRLHGSKLLKQVQEGDQERAQLGLGHAYSRAKVKFSVQKNDNHIIQAIATLDHMDKAANTFTMRVREWYSWHFPELAKIISTNALYPKAVLFVGDKTTLTEDKLHDLAAIIGDDEGLSRQIIDAARVSMGRDISEEDMDSIMQFAARASKLIDNRKTLHEYLVNKMGVVAPNLGALIGETVAARLISKAGSLTNLSKFAASTVQILGAEKALFRALKTKGNTPKYGLLYHSSFISRAGVKNKGRMSRFLANKCSIASRIDNFSEIPTSKYGEAMRNQVEERLNFYATGIPPMKNSAVMDSVLNDLEVQIPSDSEDEDEPKSKKAKKEELSDEPQAAAGAAEADEMDVDIPVRVKKEKKDKKAKKEKKEKRKSEGEVDGDKQEKKKKRKHDEEEKKDKKEKKKKRKSE